MSLFEGVLVTLRRRAPWHAVVVPFCLACGGNAPGAAAPEAAPRTAVPEAAPRAALRLPVDADPNGLWWDAAAERLLAAGPNGSVFAGSATGSVHRIDAMGAVTTVHSGFRQVRGVAYDPERHRLFVAEHDPDAKKAGTGHALHVLPVD